MRFVYSAAELIFGILICRSERKRRRLCKPGAVPELGGRGRGALGTPANDRLLCWLNSRLAEGDRGRIELSNERDRPTDRVIEAKAPMAVVVGWLVGSGLAMR